jgi:transcriptional regulator GlxA family with amidase domain
MKLNGVSAWLSIDCPAEELLGAVRDLLEDAPSSRWLPANRPNDVARPVRKSAVAASRVRPRGRLAPGALRRVREYIESTFARKIDLSRLAGIAGLSTFYFSRAFRQSMGIPPHRYVTLRRVAAAAELIRKTAKPLADVAIEVGFRDQSHLTRAFNQVTGETPGALRRRYR